MSKGLDALERLVGNKVFISLVRIQGKKQFANDINIIKNELKVLEIIKKKEVNMFLFFYCKDLETYNDMVEDNRKLTQEEYESLKAVIYG